MSFFESKMIPNEIILYTYIIYEQIEIYQGYKTKHLHPVCSTIDWKICSVKNSSLLYRDFSIATIAIWYNIKIKLIVI